MNKYDDWIEIKKDSVHIKRERKRARDLKKSDWWKKQIQKKICYYCKESFEPAALTMDHILPVVRGGKTTKGNCVPCCKECNNKKKFLTPAEIVMKSMHQEN
tara:strand:+ start:372 stop:677 length:306 start_codon:yes stop_codon:yes gene_type:complete